MELKDDLKIKVTCRMEVDEATVKACLNLLNIYGRSKGLAGMVIQFGEEGPEISESIDKYRIRDMLAAV